MNEVEENDLEYESINILKQCKINAYEKMIKQSVDRKYKISLYKGVQMVLESIILFVLMVSVCMKANMFSIIYVLFICKYLMSAAKT